MGDYFQHHDAFAEQLGIQLVEAGPEYGEVTMPFDQRHRNAMGQTHGGAIFALVDMAFAAASNADGKYCVNAQTSIAYVTPGKLGPLKGVAKAVRLGRKLVTYDVEVSDATGTLVAKATVTGYKMGIPLPE